MPIHVWSASGRSQDMLKKLFVLLAVGLVAIKAAAVEDASSDDVGDVAQSSMLGMFGSKLAIADNVYNEYDDEDEDDDEEVGEQVTPCCFPPVWQGRLETEFGFSPLGGGKPQRSGDDKDFDGRGKKKKKGGDDCRGRPVSSRSVNQVYVDGNNKRLAGDVLESHGRGRVLNFSYILLVGANQTADLYLFDRGAQKCRYRELKGAVWRQQCIPANATLRGQFSLGPASGGLNVQSWSFFAGSGRAKAALVDGDYSALYDADAEEENDVVITTTRPRPRPQPPRPRVFLAATALVVPGSCVPVVVQEEGVVLIGGRRDRFQNDDDDDDESNKWDPKPTRPGPRPKPKPKPRGEAFVGSAFYSGLQTTITDPSVFTVPAYCKKTPNTLYYDEMEDELPSIVERFLDL